MRSYISDIVGANDDDGGDGEDDNDDYVHCWFSSTLGFKFI